MQTFFSDEKVGKFRCIYCSNVGEISQARWWTETKFRCMRHNFVPAGWKFVSQKRNFVTIRTKGLTTTRQCSLPLPAKFCLVISPGLILFPAKFQQNEICFCGRDFSARWQRHFVWLNENPRWRTFVEFSREQRTKFSEFRFHYFCTVL